ncbi:tail fiber assembly protein [Citrobacter braakii]|uniref:tail fiber assembly protein n=1 Tax=Citrobacter braakii TaxID=57706 RepID=UPI001039E20D|nr:tail fiber assembly protein [Citrobacter braakii]TCC56013.1 tail fiber assembly protein [Citrobacter braakii]
MRFSVETQSFYPDSIIYDELPDDVVEITESEHSTYLNAIISGCYIYLIDGSLAVSSPRPGNYYEWNSSNNSWEMSEAAEQQQKDDARAAATQQKSALKAAADSEIAWRLDAVNDGYATEQEAAALAEWKKYRVLLMRIETSKAPDIEWPTPPREQAS